MSPAPMLLAVVLCVLLSTGASPALAKPIRASNGRALAATQEHSLLQSRQLWATVDVCNAPNQPNTVGIRGSMPSDGHPHDRMYMRFGLQYFNSVTKLWVDLLQGASSSFLPVGSASTTRQDGRSFQLVPGQAAFMLRGVVSFQWRRGAKVVHSVTRPTTAGHTSLAGADPAGFSAATCAITST